MFNAIEDIPGLKLRLGRLVERTPNWHYAIKQAVQACGLEVAHFERHFTFRPDLQQKGVDALITLDLISLAQAGGYDCALLISGDQDLEPAVWTAQEQGRRVLLGVPERGGVSPRLRRTADDVLVISQEQLCRFLGMPGLPV